MLIESHPFHDQDGTLWVATEGGLSLADFQDWNVLLTGHQSVNEHPEQAPRTCQIAPLPRTILFIEEGRGIDTGAGEYQSTMDALPWSRIVMP